MTSELTLLAWLVPPIMGGLIGYFTNALAIAMLFRPYRPLYLSLGEARFQIPFTPGLFPKEQPVLAEQIGLVITQKLLTVEDFSAIAQTMVTPERLKPIIEKLGNRFLDSLSKDQAYESLYDSIASFLCHALSQLPEHLARELANRPEVLKQWFDKSIDELIRHGQVPKAYLEPVIELMLAQLLEPDALRTLMIQELTDANKDALGHAIAHHATGLTGLLFRFISPRVFVDNLHQFFQDEPQQANQLIGHLLTDLGVKTYLTTQLAQLSLKKLPVEVVDKVKQILFNECQTLINQYHEPLGQWIDSEQTRAMMANQLSQIQWGNWSDEVKDKLNTQLAVLIHQLLHQEIAAFVGQVLPLMKLDTIIAQKITDFSPRELEQLIVSIAKKELAGIEMAGGFIGFLIGCINSVILYGLQ